MGTAKIPDWGIRNTELTATLDGVTPGTWTPIGYIGVDTGRVGFFAQGTKDQALSSVVANSGTGDGAYQVQQATADKGVVGVRVIFVPAP